MTASVIAAGTVESVDTGPVGSATVGTAASGDLSLFVNDNTDFTPGDEVYITPLDADTGDTYVIGAVDDEAGITLNTPLVDDLPENSWVALSPVRSQTVAMVQLADFGEPVPCIVLHTLRDAFRDGIRDDSTAETVLTVQAGDDRYVFDIIAQPPVRDLTDAVVGPNSLTDTLQDIYDTADANAAAAADAAANATIALTAANGKNTVTYSLSTPGATANTAGDIWFQKDSATQTIIGQWQGQGGTSWQQVALADAVIANLDAGKLVAGSAFINALSVKTNFTLGDASTNGVIQSYNFAGSSVGIYLDKFGLVAKGGSIAGATITGGSVESTGGGGTVRLSGGVLDFIDSGGTHTPIYGSGGLLLIFGNAQVWNDLQVSGDLNVSGTATLGAAHVGGELTVGSMGGALDMGSHSVTNAYNVTASNQGSFGSLVWNGKAVTQGASGSGGTGLRALCVPN